MIISILESEYEEPDRPISLNELNDLQKKIYNNLKLSSIMASHNKCKHFYFVKKNGKKEKDIKEQNLHGNCSVCWKLYKTPKNLKNKAHVVIECYSNIFSNKIIKYNYKYFDLEKTFYNWLYIDDYSE